MGKTDLGGCAVGGRTVLRWFASEIADNGFRMTESAAVVQMLMSENR
jgi:hypothetical protein